MATKRYGVTVRFGVGTRRGPLCSVDSTRTTTETVRAPDQWVAMGRALARVLMDVPGAATWRL
jgi:hypothetical protein